MFKTLNKKYTVPKPTSNMKAVKKTKEEAVWEKIKVTENQPTARHNHTTVLHEESLYVYGGETLKQTDEVYEFNLNEKVWTTHKNTKGLILHSHTSVVIGEQMLVYGGKNYEKNETSNLFQCFDFNKKTFEILPNNTVPGLSNHSSVADGNKIYIFGGYDSSSKPQNKLYSYDIKKKEWKEELLKGVKIPEIASFQMEVAGKCLYIIGGINSNSKSINSVYQINLNNFEVTAKKPEHPIRVAYAGIVKLNEDELMVVGGGIDDNSNSTEFWLYRIEDNEWEQIEYGGLTQSYSNPSVILQNNHLFLYGGSIGFSAMNFSGDLFCLKIQHPDIKSLLYKKDFSDCQVRIGSELYFAHKSILFQSKNFKDILVKDDLLDLSKFDATLMHRVLKYMYGFKLVVNGDELFSLVKLSKQLEYLELEVHCTCQLTDMKPEYILDLLAKTEEEIRQTYNERFYAKDVMKQYCLEKFQEMGQTEFLDTKEAYEKFQVLHDDLKMELILASSITKPEDSSIPQDNERIIQIREHYANLLSEKLLFDCVLKSTSHEFQSHKLLYVSSPIFVKQFSTNNTISFGDKNREVELLHKIAYDPSYEMKEDDDELFDAFCDEHQLSFIQNTSTKKIKWDSFKPSFEVQDKDCKILKNNGTDPRMAFSSFVIKKGMKDVEIGMKVTYVSWIGVGVCEASKVQNQDYTWNYSGGYQAHGTNLWSMNGYTWTTDSNTHQKSGKPNYGTGDVIVMKVCTKESELRMRRKTQSNWEVILPITLPVCFCGNFGGVGDIIEIISKVSK